MRREYKHPPVEELVLGVYFAKPLLSLRAEHVGLFWHSVKKEFPSIEQQPPIKVIISAPDEPFPMPRFWLKTETDAYLVQIQRNAFLVNWRKRGEDDYPHFAAVKTAFDRHYSAFADFMREELKSELVIELCELNYSNFADIDEVDAAAVIPTFQPLRTGVPNSRLRSINVTNTFEVASDLTLIVTLRTGRRATEKKTPVLIFDQRVTGRIKTGTRTEADTWFERAHDVTGVCFNNLTSARFRNEVWQPREND